MARLPDGECSASECSLICNDYWEQGYGRIIMVPRVKLAYDKVSPLSSASYFFFPLLPTGPLVAVILHHQRYPYQSFYSPDHPSDDKLIIVESIRHHPPRTS
jgi:hypothetical protein